MAERLKDDLRSREPAVDLVVGNFEKEQIPDMLDSISSLSQPHTTPLRTPQTVQNEEKPFHFEEYHQRENDFHAFVPIMHGCNNFCTYCIVPHVRGREVSRPPEEITNELDHLESHGVKEITLLGQNVNSYSYHTENGIFTFTDILQHILEHISSIEWVRFLTSHPKDVPPQLIEMIASDPRLCNHIHLPVQHGSSSVLQRMNRKYTREDYMRIIDHIRDSIEEPSITTDIMIGFPGETEQDFQDTVELIRQVEFDDAFLYYFNPREGTPAANFDHQVEHKTKLQRLSEIIALQKEITHKKKIQRVGRTERVIVESFSKKNKSELLGRTERDHMVVFPGPSNLIGRFADIKIETVSGNTLKGTMTQ
jgi:tRNA-2-methylthio-N6-dimethylallyladenosine synthase